MSANKVVPVDEELLREAAAVFGDYGNSTMRAKLLDAIHAAPAPSGEAVLWQWRRKGDPWTLDKTFNTEVFATTDDSEVRPLFAHPPAREKAMTTEREAYERLKADSYTVDYAGFLQRQSDIEVLWQARAALQSAPGQEPVGPVAEVETVYVRPNADGKYRAIVVSDERLSQGAELFVQPPTATVEAATERQRFAQWATREGYNLASYEHEATIYYDDPATQHAWDGFCAAAREHPSQPAQQAEPLYSDAPDCYDGWPEHDTTTPQAEAQAGETPRTDVWLKRNEWRAVKTSYVDELIAHTKRLERELQAASAELDRERMQLAAQPQAVEEAAKVDTYALQLLEAAKCPDCAGCVGGVMVEPGVFEQNECEWCFRRWQALEPLRALRNAGKEE